MATLRAGLAETLPPPQWLTAADGKRLAFSAYLAQAPWLRVLVSHGFGEHRGWWHHVCGALQAQGVSAYSFDHFHHGLSDGRPADVRSYDELSDGLCLALEACGSAGPPLLLLAHSNGGMVALRTLPRIAEQVQGLALSSPLIGLPWVLRTLGVPLARVLHPLNPGMFWPTKINPALLTTDRSLWADYERDPLRFRHISVRFFLAMAAECQAAAPLTDLRGVPLLLLTAELDRVVDLQATLAWYGRLPPGDREHIAHAGRCHELFNEDNWPAVLGEVLSWARRHWAAPSAVSRPA